MCLSKLSIPKLNILNPSTDFLGAAMCRGLWLTSKHVHVAMHVSQYLYVIIFVILYQPSLYISSKHKQNKYQKQKIGNNGIVDRWCHCTNSLSVPLPTFPCGSANCLCNIFSTFFHIHHYS